jgi:hypothetical protein
MPDAPPKVSVLMPVFNGLPHLPQALQSVLAQTFADFELIAVDDGSHDQSGKVLDDYAGRDRRVRVIHAEHGGLVPALRRAHAAARGTLLARMDADDVSYPRRFERQVELLQSRPDVAVVCCAADVLDDEGKRIGERIPEFHADMLLELAAGNPIVHGSVMMRRSAFEEAGGYKEPPEDYDLWIRMARRDKKFAVVRGEPPSPTLYGFRTHAQRYSLVRLREQSAAILRVQLPLLEEATRKGWSSEPRATAQRTPAVADAAAFAKLIEGWGRISGAASICGQPELANRALERVLEIYTTSRRFSRAAHERRTRISAFHTAADAIVWSGPPRRVALRLRFRQLLTQPTRPSRWRDLALALFKRRTKPK